MSMKSKTYTKGKTKIKMSFEYNLSNIRLYVNYANNVGVQYADNKGLSEYEIANRLLRLYFDLLDMTIDRG